MAHQIGVRLNDWQTAGMENKFIKLFPLWRDNWLGSISSCHLKLISSHRSLSLSLWSAATLIIWKLFLYVRPMTRYCATWVCPYLSMTATMFVHFSWRHFCSNLVGSQCALLINRSVVFISPSEDTFTEWETHQIKCAIFTCFDAFDHEKTLPRKKFSFKMMGCDFACNVCSLQIRRYCLMFNVIIWCELSKSEDYAYWAWLNTPNPLAEIWLGLIQTLYRNALNQLVAGGRLHLYLNSLAQSFTHRPKINWMLIQTI